MILLYISCLCYLCIRLGYALALKSRFIRCEVSHLCLYFGIGERFNDRMSKINEKLMKKVCVDLRVHSVEHLSERHVLLRLRSEDSLPEMVPGQFVEVKVNNSPTTFLRRPISINLADNDRREILLLVASVGDGTRRLTHLSEGDMLNCLLPLGNGFSLPTSLCERFLLIGGGVGIAPLLFLGKKIVDMGGTPFFLLGARTACELLEKDRFGELGHLYVTTEDGSEGVRGFVTDHPILTQQHFDRIATCGPKPMMLAVARYAKREGIACEVSLENEMACGLGACLCCVENTTEGYVCVCKEGPVFSSDRLLWKI